MWFCSLQPIAIGSCGYASSSETVEEASRRVEHAGNTPPSTPALDAELAVDETAEDISHVDLHDLDASYPLSIAQGQPPMERHLVPLSAVPTALPPPALPTVFPTPFPFWDASLSPAGFAAVPQSIQVYTMGIDGVAKSSSRHAQIQLLDEMFSGALLACCEHGIRGMPRCYESASTPKQGGGSGLCPRRGRSFDENPHFDSPAQSTLF